MSRLRNVAQLIFKSSLESVKPDKLVAAALHRSGNFLRVNGRSYELKNNVKVIGFGKAVHGKICICCRVLVAVTSLSYLNVKRF